MQLQLIRNATLRLRYAGHTILIDPDLADKHSRPSFTGLLPNPMVDLPLSPTKIVAGIDLLIVSHLHRDHFDAVEPIPAAAMAVPRARCCATHACRRLRW